MTLVKDSWGDAQKTEERSRLMGTCQNKSLVFQKALREK